MKTGKSGYIIYKQLVLTYSKLFSFKKLILHQSRILVNNF